MSSKVCNIRILDEVNVVLTGLTSEHLMYFYEKYAKFAPNYFFNPKYKLGTWNGKIRFFHKTGKTHVYLLEDILPKIESLGYTLNLVDLRETYFVQPDNIDEKYFNHIIDPETGNPITLRTHQVEAVNVLMEHGNGIAVAATGSGKTLIATALSDSYNKHGLRSIIIVPNRDLIAQTKEVFRFCQLDTGEYSGASKDIQHDHVISTWQALKNNPTVIKEFDVVVVDECLSIDTKIRMANGTQKNIQDVVKGDEILSYNVDTGIFEIDEVVKQHKNLTLSSYEQMYELQFDNGTTIQVTGNHKFLTTTGYRRADELTEVDEIINVSDRVS